MISVRTRSDARRVRRQERVAWLLLAACLALGVAGAVQASATPLPDCCAHPAQAHDASPCSSARPCLSPLDACGCGGTPLVPTRGERSSVAGPAAGPAVAAPAPLPAAPRLPAPPAAAQAARRALLQSVVLLL
ncbi:MAG: hypothetical protein OEM67_00300 [Thermoleophilia bacterium]|nr:hypothetical protein [Thermoleophilia bacterium]